MPKKILFESRGPSARRRRDRRLTVLADARRNTAGFAHFFARSIFSKPTRAECACVIMPRKGRTSWIFPPLVLSTRRLAGQPPGGRRTDSRRKAMTRPNDTTAVFDESCATF